MSGTPASACLDEVELLDLADGVPSPELRVRAEAHVDGCAACREQLAGFLRARVPSGEHPGPTLAPGTETVAPRRASNALPQLSRGTLLGRYVVLERIGAGGMGVVYAAYDPSIDRRIVLKLLHAGPEGTGSVGQRMREAQAAARTQHPNVVAVHDVGTFDDLVFIAMELVDGGTLRQHLAAARPPWHQVVRLYLQAGRGLAAAHAAGVIHRDFKPDNVLVDRSGRVRVTDFGLARMAVDLAPAGDAVTPPGPRNSTLRATSVAGTPGYIPPEVLAGKPADARSDQYSFCVSLYEGLYGTRPSREGALTSAARSPVPRAVHAIVVRGLAPAPGERHPSMEALLQALDAAAFPRTRRKAFVAAGAALAVASVAVVTAARPTPCTDAASRLTGIWDSTRKGALLAAFTATGAPTAASLHSATSRTLDAYAAAWTEAHRDACQATRVRGEQSEAAMDLRMRCLERRRRELGALADVLLTADAAGTLRAPEAAQALRPLAACADVEALAQPVPPPDRPGAAPRVEAAFERLADARARLHTGRWKEAVERAGAIASEAEALGYKPLLGEALLVQGIAQTDLRDEKAATAALRRATLASLAGRDTKHAIEALAYLIHVEGELTLRPEQVELWSEQAQALLESVGGDPLLESLVLRHRGNALARQGRQAEAIPVIQQALTLQERLDGSEHVSLSAVLNMLGDALKGMGRLDEALAHQQRAQALLEKAYGPDHPRVAILLNNQGTTLVALNRYTEALARQEESLARLERAHGPGQPANYVIALLGNMGAIHYSLGRLAEAERTLGRALRLAREAFPTGHPHRVRIGNNLALMLGREGRPEESLALFQELKKEQQVAAAEGRRNLVFARTFSYEAEVLVRIGQSERAVASARQALVLARELGAESERAGLLPALAQALLAAGDLPEAHRTIQEAVELQRRLAGAGRPLPPEVQQVLGEVLLARGDAAGALDALEQTLAAWEKAAVSPADMAPTRFALARALRLGGKEPARARALATAAREALAPTAEPRRVRLADIDAFLRAP